MRRRGLRFGQLAAWALMALSAANPAHATNAELGEMAAQAVSPSTNSVTPATPVPTYQTAPATAAGGGLYLRPQLEAGYELGGTKLVEVLCEDSNGDTSTPGLRAGSGLVVGGGAHAKLSRESPFDLRLMFDYKYQAACQSVNLQRFRFTALPTYHFGPRQRWWAGAGFIYETGIRFDGKNLPIEGTNETLGTLHFDDASGATLQLGWWFVALDYNFIKYSSHGDHVNANSVGVLFTYGFDEIKF